MTKLKFEARLVPEKEMRRRNFDEVFEYIFLTILQRGAIFFFSSAGKALEKSSFDNRTRD